MQSVGKHLSQVLRLFADRFAILAATTKRIGMTTGTCADGSEARHAIRSVVAAAAILGIGMCCQARAATELEERELVQASTTRMFMTEDFAALEEISRVYRTTKSRTPSGLWHLTLFYAGIDVAIGTASAADRDTAFAELEAKAQRWAAQYPSSPAAHIAYSMVLISHGWALRGSGYARSVEPDAWARFYEYIALARENLEQYKSTASRDPRWYETMLIVARAEGWERTRFEKLLEEALAEEPLFYQTYFLALEYLLPKWHGGIGDIEAFARDAVERTSAEEGQGMYARIYWFASQAHFGNALFDDSLAVWVQMKAGFDDLIARYPDAWNLNHFAKFSCLAGDKEKTRELLQRIESSVVPEAWQPPSLLGHCSDWSSRPMSFARVGTIAGSPSR